MININKKNIKEVLFSEIDINQSFFDSLKKDYPGFSNWFHKKSMQGRKAFVSEKEGKVVSFLSFKRDEIEEIELENKTLESKKRFKIATLKLSDEVKGNRLGEAYIYNSILEFYRTDNEEIYITIFPKYKELIGMVMSYGFKEEGNLKNGELLFSRIKKPETGFCKEIYPYIRWGEKTKTKVVTFEAEYHDRLFPTNLLYNTNQEIDYSSEGTGITKTYLSNSVKFLELNKGDPLLIYRKKHPDDSGSSGNKSVISGISTFLEYKLIKNYGQNPLISLKEYLGYVGNSSVYSLEELKNKYSSNKALVVIKMINNINLGKGKNVNYNSLKDHGFFESSKYPNEYIFNKEETKNIIKLGGSDVHNIIID